MKTNHYIPKFIICLLIINWQLSLVNYIYSQTIINVAGIMDTTRIIGGYTGDGGPATAAELDQPSSVCIDISGNVYISDAGNNVIREVNTLGIISTIAGDGYDAGQPFGGYYGDGGPATAAEFFNPIAVAVDPSGNLYIADEENYVVRKVNSSGKISTIAGNHNLGYGGDGGPATAAQLYDPNCLAIDASGNLYISDGGNNVIREVNTSGIISTIAGNHSYGAGYSGDGGQATAAELYGPNGITFDATGNLYFADWENNVVRIVNTSGIINTIVGNHQAGYSGDSGPATAAELRRPYGVAVDASGNLLVGDQYNMVVRKVNTSGIISTFAGNHKEGWSGDGGPATAAELYYPSGIAFDAWGELYIADQYNNIRKVDTVLCSLSTNISMIQNVSCTGGSNGIAMTTSYGGTMPYTYLWSNGVTNATFSGLPTGAYTLTVTDAKGCFTKSGVTISLIPPPPPEICYVTVDTSSKYNVIVWQKAGMDTNTIDSVLILRQLSNNTYIKLGEVSVHGLTIFTDSSALPNTLSYFYSLGILNVCSYYDTSVNYNKTILLQSSLGVGNKVNLNWNEYEGQTVNLYRILKDSLGNGNWRELDSVPPGNTAYTDNNPGNAPNLRYVINTKWSVSCSPYMVPPPHRNDNRAMSNLKLYDEAYSNITHIYQAGIVAIAGENNRISIEPNPNNGEFTIQGLEVSDALSSVEMGSGVKEYRNSNF